MGFGSVVGIGEVPLTATAEPDPGGLFQGFEKLLVFVCHLSIFGMQKRAGLGSHLFPEFEQTRVAGHVVILRAWDIDQLGLFAPCQLDKSLHEA